MKRYCEICCEIVTEAPGPHSCSVDARLSYARNNFYTPPHKDALIAASRHEQVADQIRKFSTHNYEAWLIA